MNYIDDKSFKGIKLDDWKHRFGHTKMFFKAGVIGDLEDERDEKDWLKLILW